MTEQRIKPTAHVYTCMIDAYSKDGDMDSSLEWWKAMQHNRVEPTPVTYACVIAGHAKRQQWLQVEALWQSMADKRVKPTAHAYASCIDAYGRAGRVERCSQLWSELQQSSLCDTVVFNCMLAAYTRNDMQEAATQCLQDMVVAALRPDCTTYTSIMDAAQSCAAADYWMQDMRRRGVRPNAAVFNVLVSLHGEAGNVAQAQRYFEEATAVGAVDTALCMTHQRLCGHADASVEVQAAKATRRNMELSGVRPSARLSAGG
eukprot:NODE_674_length_1714_cov_75.499055_g664_i0.p1 GENE.NODE_674_length_1714_cov_75.499055_g664_i0~~NODE_674_length_1714_cov_75.499055_g664_i0.p1  ORF type:complete len:260 (-),score=58.45 NODE_674_length_1714_cov_75.499055_g664_i0:215-994(-)